MASVLDGVGDLIFDNFREGEGDAFLPGFRFFLEDFGETALLGGDGVRSFFAIFFDGLGDTKSRTLNVKFSNDHSKQEL